MANYLLKYKGKYRILPELDQNTNDFPRNEDGSIEDIDIYIACQYGNKIFSYGSINNKKDVWLQAYIPSIGRGHNIVKALNKQKIEYDNYVETDEEVEFIFKAKDIDTVAELMKVKTSGASISPFSNKNLPKSKIEIPSEDIAKYKEITGVVPKGDLLSIHRVTTSFLEDVLQKIFKKKNKEFDYKSDMKTLSLSRQTKEYIYTKGLWEEYLDYLKENLGV